MGLKTLSIVLKLKGNLKIEQAISKQRRTNDSTEDVREFINAHIQKSLTDDTDLKLNKPIKKAKLHG